MSGIYQRDPSDPSPLSKQPTPPTSTGTGGAMDFGGDPSPLNRAPLPPDMGSVSEGARDWGGDPSPLNRNGETDFGLPTVDQ